MTTKQQILALVQQNTAKTGGKSGLSVPRLMAALDLDFETLKPHLNQLFKEHKIKIKQGLNGLLLF